MIAAAGRMGWKSDDFWFSTPSFFFAAYAGYMRQERDRIYHGYKQARLVAYYAYAPHNKEGITIVDIIRLPGDDEVRELQYPEVTQDELEKFNAAADRAYQQLNLAEKHGIGE